MRASEEAGKRATLLAFGRLLKRLRVAADLTQEELAERAMVSARLISDLERGTIHRPRRDTAQLLADGLGLHGPERDSFIALARGRPLAAAGEPSSESRTRHTVPYPPTPIVGRLKETAAATALLLDRDVRLLTLTGLGGVGKTRLALEVALKLADALPDGAVFVDLAPVRDPELVLTATARALGVVPDPNLPLREGVIAALRDKRLLLLMDNFEHVTEAATAVADLLASCSALKILVTSRMPLHIRAEHEYPVGPLAVPDLDDLLPLAELAQVPAVALLVRRAEAASHDFALSDANARAMAEITARLDGLPLAIELAATRLRVLSPAALLARLESRLPLLTGGARDLPERQQAIRATLDWSHELLSTSEQMLFRRLAVFAGGCSLDAAEWMSLRARGDDGEESQEQAALPSLPSSAPATLDLLAGLVDKSLLRAADDGTDQRRFGMLETIREYGLVCLSTADEECEVRRWHMRWCLDLAERAEPELTGADQQQWYARLALEHDNMRVALGWAIAHHDADAALRFGGALYRFWATLGHYEEGRRWLEQILALDSGEQSTSRGNALIGAGVMAFFRGDYDRAAQLWEESLALFRALENVTGIAYSYGNLGLVADARGDYDRATASYERALALFRQLGDQTYVGFMLHNIGLIAYFQGDYARATTLFEESLAIARAREDQGSVPITLGNLALVAVAQEQYDRATALQHEALSIGQHLSNRPWLARGVEHFALIAAATREPERAARLFGAAEAVRERFDAAVSPNDRDINARYMAIARDQIGEEAFAAAWAEGAAMPLHAAIAYALNGDEVSLSRKTSAGRTNR